MKYKIAVAYPDADTSDIDQAISDLNQRLLAMNQDLGNRQTKLENALLACGKFQDALQSLLDWLSAVEPSLSTETAVMGDPETVQILIDNHKVRKVCYVFNTKRKA